MKRFVSGLFLFTLAINFTANPVLAEDIIKIISPQDMVWVNGRLINLVYRIKSDSYDATIITLNSHSDQVQPGAIAKLGIHHSSLLLTGGRNRISIQVLKDKKILAKKIITVYLRSNLNEQYDTPPHRFKQYTFHTGYNEIICRPCHAEELLENSKSRQNEELPSCYTCHKKIIDYKYVHGPASVWTCSMCHNKNTAELKNGVPSPEITVCRMCHTEELAAWQTEKFGHGPTMAGKCAFCHNPHASDENFFLRTGTSDLCGYCHQDKLMKPHIVADFFKQGHPVKREGGKAGERTITCASCHNPHASNNVNLLIGFKESITDFCGNCHIR